jgi:hypothetical protein
MVWSSTNPEIEYFKLEGTLNGTAERSKALVIKLASDEKRRDLDFIAPRQ